MKKMPRDRAPDSSVALLGEGYTFIPDRCREMGSDLFSARLLLRRTICMTGPEAARLFYDESRFARKGAAPIRLRTTLFGIGGVQGLDDEAHRERKAMLMSLMTPRRVQDLADRSETAWRSAIQRWADAPSVCLFEEVERILCRAVCDWAGVPVPEGELEKRRQQLVALIEGSGALGPRHWRGRKARVTSELWLSELVAQVRAGAIRPPAESALAVIAGNRNLTPRLAAVELLNVLRPTVAVARFVVFAAVALHDFPAYAARLRSGDEDLVRPFVQEVRRFYPFFPFTAAKVRTTFEWKGYRFPKGTRVLLDLFGTNRDPRTWDRPDEFRPERFRSWDGSPFSFIPQGGGDFWAGHRCAGEWITIALLEVAVRMLTQAMRYRVPEQDLSISLSRIPAAPASRFVISDVEPLLPARESRSEAAWTGSPA